MLGTQFYIRSDLFFECVVILFIPVVTHEPERRISWMSM